MYLLYILTVFKTLVMCNEINVSDTYSTSYYTTQFLKQWWLSPFRLRHITPHNS